jgi:hypothetical protein
MSNLTKEDFKIGDLVRFDIDNETSGWYHFKKENLPDIYGNLTFRVTNISDMYVVIQPLYDPTAFIGVGGGV